MDAAAIERHRRSPPITVSWEISHGIGQLPSTSRKSAGVCSAATARPMASSDARRMLIRSISSWVTDATAHATASRRITG